MKILFISDGYPSAINPNMLIFFQRLVNELARQGHKCYVIAPSKSPREKKVEGLHERQNEPNVVEVYYPRYFCLWLTKRGKHDFVKDFTVHNYVRAVEKTIEKNRIEFDVVYSHFLNTSCLCATMIGEKYHKPVFAAAGESKFSAFSGYDKEKNIAYLNKLTGIISVSRDNKNIILDNHVLSDEKILVAPNGIDDKVFCKKDREESREKFGFSKDDFIIAFTGHFIERKGPLRLLEAVKGLPVKVAFAGSGPQTPDGDCVIWNKPVDPHDMPFFYSAADIFVLPTLNEGCCNAIIEAMACGLPVISSDMAFNDDILDEGCSIRVETSDVSAIRSAIDDLYSNQDKLISMSRNAVNKGRSFSLRARASRIINWMAERIQ